MQERLKLSEAIMSRLLFRSSLVMASCIFLASCSSMYDHYVQWETITPKAFPVINATGYAPISLQKSTNKTQRMLMAINASKLAAYAELAEQVYGQQINSSTTMADLLINDQSLNASVKGVIRGAKVVKSYPVGDTYATELTLDFKDVYDIYQSMKRDRTIKSVNYF